MNATASTDSKPNKRKREILLQTARAVAVGPAGIRMLLDSGSQFTYIAKTLKERLGIEPIQKEKLHLNTFGSALLLLYYFYNCKTHMHEHSTMISYKLN